MVKFILFVINDSYPEIISNYFLVHKLIEPKEIGFSFEEMTRCPSSIIVNRQKIIKYANFERYDKEELIDELIKDDNAVLTIKNNYIDDYPMEEYDYQINEMKSYMTKMIPYYSDDFQQPISFYFSFIKDKNRFRYAEHVFLL